MNHIVFTLQDMNDFSLIQEKFNSFLSDFYINNKRDLLWREVINPYYVLVSEYMLQQTQVNRVIDYFNNFISIFPTFEVLALADQSEVLKMWIGLGYNRRAIFLHQAVKEIYFGLQQVIPQDIKRLKMIKGIGEYTAAALLTYVYNMPTVFVETNVRTVFFIIFQEFFQKNNKDDKEIKNIIEKIIDRQNPRIWYYALMDLGTQFKKIYKNKDIHKSNTYKKQSLFKNSNRELRGKILKILTYEKKIFFSDLCLLINDTRIEKCLEQLKKELFLTIDDCGFITLL